MVLERINVVVEVSDTDKRAIERYKELGYVEVVKATSKTKAGVKGARGTKE